MIYKNSQGFTLIELLLVIALMAISVGITSDILVSLVRSYNKSTIINELEQQANFVGLKIENDLRNATNVTATIGNGGRLEFVNDDGTTVYYNYANNNLYRSTTGYVTTTASALIATPAIGQAIGGASLTCNGPGGNCFTLTTGVSDVVEVTMLLSQASTNGSVTFEGQIPIVNTIVLRNSY